jgi:hypothetical protein
VGTSSIDQWARAPSVYRCRERVGGLLFFSIVNTIFHYSLHNNPGECNSLLPLIIILKTKNNKRNQKLQGRGK